MQKHNNKRNEVLWLEKIENVILLDALFFFRVCTNFWSIVEFSIPMPFFNIYISLFTFLSPLYGHRNSSSSQCNVPIHPNNYYIVNNKEMIGTG